MTAIFYKIVLRKYDWCSNNNMSVSYKKTKAMTLQLNSKKIICENILINGNKISEEESYTKILGIYIDKKLNFIKHVDFIVAKCEKLLRGMNSTYMD